MTISYCQYIWSRQPEDPGIVYVYSDDDAPLGWLEQLGPPNFSLLATNHAEEAEAR